jgi:hypothetical protein
MNNKIDIVDNMFKNTQCINKFQCLQDNCGFIWNTRINHIIYKTDSGCPYCKNKNEK